MHERRRTMAMAMTAKTRGMPSDIGAKGDNQPARGTSAATKSAGVRDDVAPAQETKGKEVEHAAETSDGSRQGVPDGNVNPLPVATSCAGPAVPGQPPTLVPTFARDLAEVRPSDQSSLDRVVRCASFVQGVDGSARFTLRLDGETLTGVAIRVEADVDGCVCVKLPGAAVRSEGERELVAALARRLRGAGVRLIEVEADA